MRLSLIIIVLLWCATLKAQVTFNGNFEALDASGNPTGWDLTYHHSNTYTIRVDSIEKRQGKYSVSIASGTNDLMPVGTIVFPINQRLHGKLLTLIANIKTEQVRDGWAGIWLRVDGVNKKILDVTESGNKGPKGTATWKEYMVQLPYDEHKAVTINAGAELQGKGKMWVDSMRLYLDEKPIDQARLSTEPLYRALQDTAFAKGSGIYTVKIDKRNKVYLTLLGQLWGFLKYHHDAVARGGYNWDAELFRMLPKLLDCHTDAQVSALFEQWVDRLGKPAPCAKCRPWTTEKSIVLKPDYGSLFTNKVFSKTLINKLQYILNNHSATSNYYVDIHFLIPAFTNEAEYPVAYPDAGYRLLALYRYWNIIQYFCPNRGLITENWNNMLPLFIPQVLAARNKTEYALAINRLVAHTHDTHAFIGSLPVNQYQGIYRLPVAAHFIEGKLVVTGYYKDTLNVKRQFKIGDVITAINGKQVTDLMKRYLPIISASNYDSQLRDMPGKCLLRSNNRQFKITLLHNQKVVHISCLAAKVFQVDDNDFNRSSHAKMPGYYLLNKDIGYLFPAMYRNDSLTAIKKAFKSTKGIIVDMRCYPGDEMEATFGNYIKAFTSDFVKFTTGSLVHPGSFTYTTPSQNGKKNEDNYGGKVIVIVNALAQSNAEFVTMAFQSSPNVTVIGSTTAGADGNITPITLPGMFYTYMSGIGVFYPDGTNAQRAGVKINYIVNPTIKGIKAGRDELLEKAEELISGRSSISKR